MLVVPDELFDELLLLGTALDVDFDELLLDGSGVVEDPLLEAVEVLFVDATDEDDFDELAPKTAFAMIVSRKMLILILI